MATGPFYIRVKCLQFPNAYRSLQAANVQVRQPVMYSGPVGSQSLNQRASWLMGRQVHGDALVSYCRLRPCEWRTPSVKWASFPLPLFWAWAGAGMPGPEYAHKCNMPLIANLPHTYRSGLSIQAVCTCRSPLACTMQSPALCPRGGWLNQVGLTE